MKLPIGSALAVLLAAATVAAQRETAALAWKKHEVAIDYGAAIVGKHKLEDLRAGDSWRMGMNEASTVRLSVPIWAGETIAAPGSYRVKIQRSSEKELDLMIEGAGLALGGSASNALFRGELSAPPKATKKLELTWKKPKASGTVAATELAVAFGETQLTLPVTAIDTVAQKGKAFTATLFAWPDAAIDARIEKGLPTPIALMTSKHKKEGEVEGATFNLVVTDKTAKLVPTMRAPTESFGFGEVVAPAPSAIVEGKIEWSASEASTATAGPALAATSWSDDGKQLTAELTVGKRKGKLTIDLTPTAGR